jgi:hypothetical protein
MFAHQAREFGHSNRKSWRKRYIQDHLYDLSRLAPQAALASIQSHPFLPIVPCDWQFRILPTCPLGLPALPWRIKRQAAVLKLRNHLARYKPEAAHPLNGQRHNAGNSGIHWALALAFSNDAACSGLMLAIIEICHARSVIQALPSGWQRKAQD